MDKQSLINVLEQAIEDLKKLPDGANVMTCAHPRWNDGQPRFHDFQIQLSRNPHTLDIWLQDEWSVLDETI